ncbi:MAG: hypothetical protein KC646_15660 [Candidatus Cloacimonetes bacterium]|nr:hypothetical protein [Candidatus Cloacimonadota bacterium]
MRATYILLIFSLLLLTGCGKKNRPKIKARPSFLMMATQADGVNDWIDDLADLVNTSDRPEEELVNRLDEVYSTRMQTKIMFPLFDRLEKPYLKKQLLLYFAKNSSSILPENFVNRVKKSDKYLSEMMDIYFASGVVKHAKELETLYRNKKRLSLKELIQLSELLVKQGKFAESSKYLRHYLPKFAKQDRIRASFLLGKIAFFQEDYKVANAYLRPLFHVASYREIVVDYIVDSFILQKKFKTASRFIKVYALQNFESAHPHTLNSKVLLFSKNYKVALKEWRIAKDLGADSSAFHIQSFYMSHYYPKSVKDSDMGIFAVWKKGHLGKVPPIRSLAFQNRRSYLNQYNLLSMKNDKILQKVGNAYGVELKAI